MTIQFKPVPRVNPSKRTEEPKYYVSLNSKGVRDSRYIATEIADRSSLNVMDVQSSLEGFLQIIPKILIDGYTVDLGEFGKMILSAQSEGSENIEDVNASKVNQLKVSFRPGPLFKKELQAAKLEKIKTEPVEDPSEN